MIPKLDLDMLRRRDASALKEFLKQPIAIGYAGVLLMATTISLWAFAVPLTEATVAAGTVSVSAQRRTVSHVNGGKIEKLLVAEGDSVQPGQILLKLDTQELELQRGVLRDQRFARLAATARLTAERNLAQELTFRTSLLEEASANPALAQFLEAEQRNFEARRESYAAKKALLEEPGKKANEQRARLSQQLASIDRQLVIVRQQADNARELFNKGFGTKSTAIAFERDVEQLLTRRLEVEADLADLENLIGDSERKQELHQAEFRDDVESHLVAVKRELAEIEGKIQGIEDKIDDQVIRSSVQGIVVDLRDLSVNDVVTAAAPIADIIPTDSAFIVEAHLPPSDIDGVVEGLDVDVRFPAFSPAGSTEAKGHLTFVSADVVQDDRTRQAYYRVHVAIEDWPPLDSHSEIIPGMPAEVVIKKRDRTFFEYLLAPLSNHAAKAFAA